MTDNDLSLQAFKSGSYTSIQELIGKFRAGIFPDGLRKAFPPVVRRLRQHPNELEALSRYLSRLGITKVALYEHGSNAILLRTTKSQIIRIALTEDAAFPEHPLPSDLWEVLQPIKSHRIGECAIETMPEVDVKPDAWSLVQTMQSRFQDRGAGIALAIALAKKGYLCFDPSSPNIGYINNIPILIDRGAVVPLDKATPQCWQGLSQVLHFPITPTTNPEALVESLQRCWQSKRHPYLSHYWFELPTYDCEAAQRGLLKALGLRLGKVSGARSGQLAHYLDEQPDNSKPLGSAVARARLAKNLGVDDAPAFVEAAKDSGGYDRKVAERMRQQGKKLPEFLERVTRRDSDPTERS